MLSFSEAVKICMFQKFASIEGRATRAEYWWFLLFTLLTIYVPIIIAALFYSIDEDSIFGGLFVVIGVGAFFITAIPSICARIRRYHDAGHSGYFIFWNLVPYVGPIISLVVELTDSKPDNEYGPNPFTSITSQDDITKNKITND